MGKKINLNENLIIKKYLLGNSSLVLAKEFNVSKPKILGILQKNNVVRKKDRCKSLDIKQVDGKFITKRICPNCKHETIVSTTHPTTTCRNYFNAINKKSVCKKCLGEIISGENNPFYGKKHSEKTKTQISKSREGKATGDKNSMANPEHRKKARDGFMMWIKKTSIKYSSRSKKEKELYNIIKQKYKNVKHSFVVENYVCDIFIPEKNLIIEYNGDYWHCNPTKYNKNYFHKIKNKTAKEIWEYDKNRIDLLKQKGYNLEVIWETDYNKTPDLINKLLKKYE